MHDEPIIYCHDDNLVFAYSLWKLEKRLYIVLMKS